MTSSEIRAENLKRYIRERAHDNQREFADMCELKPAHVSQMVTGHRGVGPGTARKIETRLGLERGDMDRLEDALSPEAEMVGRRWHALPEPLRSQFRSIIFAGTEQRVTQR